MDTLCDQLTREQARHARDPLPETWANEPSLVGYANLGQLIIAIRRFDERASEAIKGLLVLDEHRDEATLVLLSALLPALVGRLRAHRDQIPDALAELALVIRERRAIGGHRQAGNVLLDRVCDRLRRPAGQRGFQPVIVPIEEGADLPDPAAGPERLAVDRVALDQFRAALVRTAAVNPSARDSLDRVLELTDGRTLSAAERQRLRRARTRLRAHLDLNRGTCAGS
jgi:hypothetical protein